MVEVAAEQGLRVDRISPSATDGALAQLGRLTTAGTFQARSAEAIARIVASRADEPDTSASAARAVDRRTLRSLQATVAILAAAHARL